MAWFSRGGDGSYGMYVFAWPVQQFVLLLIAPFWHAYERRLTAYPKRLAERLAVRLS